MFKRLLILLCSAFSIATNHNNQLTLHSSKPPVSLVGLVIGWFMYAVALYVTSGEAATHHFETIHLIESTAQFALYASTVVPTH